MKIVLLPFCPWCRRRITRLGEFVWKPGLRCPYADCAKELL